MCVYYGLPSVAPPALRSQAPPQDLTDPTLGLVPRVLTALNLMRPRGARGSILALAPLELGAVPGVVCVDGDLTLRAWELGSGRMVFSRALQGEGPVHIAVEDGTRRVQLQDGGMSFWGGFGGEDSVFFYSCWTRMRGVPRVQRSASACQETFYFFVFSCRKLFSAVRFFLFS